MKHHTRWLVFILLLSVFCFYVALPADVKGVTPDDPICAEFNRDRTVDTKGVRCDEHIRLELNGDFTPELDLAITQRLGLDLVGGLRVLLQADVDTSALTGDNLRDTMRETVNNINRRVNGLGLTEATVQLQGIDRVLVELPGIRDREQAVSTIQQTALLEFVDFGGLGGAAQSLTGRQILTTEQLRLQATQGVEGSDILSRARHPNTNEAFETILTGAALDRASAEYGAATSSGIAEWYIVFSIKPEFIETFARFTGSRVGQPMAIVLDGEVLSAPIINTTLSDGGIITGNFTAESARQLALQLQSGALPVPLKVIGATEVGATLGQVSVERSIRAGVVGVIIVLIFMLMYYRIPGLAANLALLVFVLLNLAAFKLIPVTLTLPAITGFLISIGTAVDGNILIFERIKEELRAGKPLDKALISGFDRAWTSIRDSNTSTIMICGILFLFGQTPGASIVSGFAVTLAIGLILNLFTAVIATRTFLYVLVGLARPTLEKRQWLLGVRGA